MWEMLQWYQKRLLSFIMFSAVILTIPNFAWAYRISPCLRVLTVESGQLSQERIYRWNQCGELPEDMRSAVHEHMTLASIRLYQGDRVLYKTQKGDWKYEYMVDKKPWGNGHLTSAIIFGSWWNDDPLMRMWNQTWNFVRSALSSHSILKPGAEKYPTDKLFCSVSASQHLAHESHYGKLQHLHFMTNLSKSDESKKIENTTELALKWMSFAYQVATKKISPLADLTTELEGKYGLPSIAKNLCDNSNNIKIKDLFTSRRMLESDRLIYTADVALGSMLHIIQDSWSSSHTCRVKQFRNGDNHKPFAVLKGVSNYLDQLADGGENNHVLQDLYPQWLTDLVVKGQYDYANDPVTVGKWLIESVDKGADWSVVESHLKETIFASLKPNEPFDDKCLFVRDK